jgi:hypothetical protein
MVADRHAVFTGLCDFLLFPELLLLHFDSGLLIGLDDLRLKVLDTSIV